MTTVPNLPVIPVVTGDDLLIIHDITTNRSGRISAAVLKDYISAQIISDEDITAGNVPYGVTTVEAGLNQRIKTVATFADLSTTTATIGQQVSVAGERGGLFDVIPVGSLISDGWKTVVNGSIAFIRRRGSTYNPFMFGADPTPGADNGIYIQAAIDAAYASTTACGEVDLFDLVWSTTTKITLRAGVFLIGHSASNYHSGMEYFADTNDSSFGTRIKAITGFNTSDPLILLDVDAAGSSRRRRGRGARSVIFDSNKIAQHSILAVGSGSDFRTDFELCNFQGSTSHGIKLANAVAFTFRNSVIGSNNGFGVFCDYGVSDSTFSDLYIHTNQSGGYYFGDGSLYCQIRGGKTEDNYGAGLFVSQSGATGTLVKVSGTIFQTNNGVNIYANGVNAQIFADNIHSMNSAVAGTGTETDTNVYASGSALVSITGGVYDGAAAYTLSAVNGGIITVGGDAIIYKGQTDRGYTATTGQVRLKNSLYELSGKTPLKNSGGRKIIKTVATSTAETFTFSDVFENGLGATFYDSATYMLIVSCAPFSNTASSRVIGAYIVSIAGAGGVVDSVGVALISAVPDPSIIASVSASVSTDDLTITITTGATHATGGRSSAINVNLVDIGQNMFGLDG